MPLPAQHFQEEALPEEDQRLQLYGHGDEVRVGWTKQVNVRHVQFEYEKYC